MHDLNKTHEDLPVIIWFFYYYYYNIAYYDSFFFFFYLPPLEIDLELTVRDFRKYDRLHKSIMFVVNLSSKQRPDRADARTTYRLFSSRTLRVEQTTSYADHGVLCTKCFPRIFKVLNYCRDNILRNSRSNHYESRHWFGVPQNRIIKTLPLPLNSCKAY